jgi:hypothetical protein
MRMSRLRRATRLGAVQAGPRRTAQAHGGVHRPRLVGRPMGQVRGHARPRLLPAVARRGEGQRAQAGDDRDDGGLQGGGRF